MVVQAHGERETYLFQFNCSRIPKPTVSCAPKNATVCLWLISPRAKGRSLVRALKKYCNSASKVKVCFFKTKTHKEHIPTALSKFLSHISLIVQPAPLITSAPRPKMLIYVNGVVNGACVA